MSAMSAVLSNVIKSGLLLDLRVGEALTFRAVDGGPVDVSALRITFEAKSGQLMRARVETPQTIVAARVSKSKL